VNQISRDRFNQLLIKIFKREGFGYSSFEKLSSITNYFCEIFLIKEVLVVLLLEQTYSRLVLEIKDAHDIVIIKRGAQLFELEAVLDVVLKTVCEVELFLL